MNPTVHPARAAPSAMAPDASPPRAREQARAERDVAERLRRQTDGARLPRLPDCCNLGTILRVLGSVNLVTLLGAWAGGLGIAQVVAALAFANTVTIPALAALCPLRKMLNAHSRGLQWAAGVGVPGAIALMVAGVASLRLMSLEGAQALEWVIVRVVLAMVFAAAIIEWLYLRHRALQPSQAEGRLQALQARIRPHFLFNSLNTVLGLMRSDTRQAERTLENLADLFRVFMRDSRELVPLDEEVLLCKEYLSIEKLRLPERLSVRWEIEDMPGDALLPSLLLQPLVENAVHHGIEPRAERGEVLVAIAKHGERVRVDIVNPLAPDAPTRSGNQMALSNVRERLSLTFDVEGQLVTTQENGQFRATVTFPYRKERRRRNVRPNLDLDR